MKVAILHYHFKRGGVTKVVENTVTGFSKYSTEVQYLCFSGEEYLGDKSLNHHVIPELGYGNALYDGKEVLTKIIALCIATWGYPPDLFHIHNHSLGKNLVMSSLLFQIVDQAIPLVLQTHDFAEDARPKNYILSKQSTILDHSILYPQSGYIHYATINKRDACRLVNAGIPTNQVSVLANPHDVHPSPDRIPKHNILNADDLTVFPVRGIRRKNIGEIALWAVLSEPGQYYAVTLTPENPQEKYFFDQWKNFCETHQLRTYLGLADMIDLSFDEVIASADRMITTSIAEGFGLSFLEPWSYRKPLIGRSINGISDDFEEQGIDLSHLYNQLLIPLSWLDQSLLKKKFDYAIRSSWSAYEREVSDHEIASFWTSITKNQSIDYALLDEETQQTVLLHLINHPQAKEELSFPKIDEPISSSTIEDNYKQVKESFNLKSYIANLLTIYNQILSSEDKDFRSIPPDNILDEFLQLKEVSLLRQ